VNNLQALVLIGHVLVAATVIGLVLLQRGKGADAGAGFGAGASGTVFGAKGSANFLSRTTAVLATLFFMTSLVLAYLGGQQRPAPSLLESAAPELLEGTGTAATDEFTGTSIDDLPELPALGPAEGAGAGDAASDATSE
jgi:preprotein translocase subunit SecG